MSEIDANGTCRTCGANVIFAKMLPSLNLAPIDVSLEHGGNVELRRNSKGFLFAKVTGPDCEQRKYISHFATCKQADDWRNKSKPVDERPSRDEQLDTIRTILSNL